MLRSFCVVLVVLGSCAPAATVRPRPDRITISIVGTNDLHGHLGPEDEFGGLPLFAGYLANLRAVRAEDGGGVLLLDGGDEFQGTLESNLNKGEAVVALFNLLGYDAMAVGNHDFDFGPVGPSNIPRAGEDPRGNLKARAAQAQYAFLAANVLEQATGEPLRAPNLAPATMREVAGVKIGIVGVATADTPTSTLDLVFRGLKLAPLAPVVTAEAQALRARGAQLVVLVAHAGLCRHVIDTDAVQECQDGEITDVVRALPAGTIDAVVAGHTHSGVVLRVGDVPITEAWKYGRGFGRIDIVVDHAGQVVDKKLLAPRQICGQVAPGTERCDRLAPAGTRIPATYEGAPVVPDARISAAIAPYLAAAKVRSEEKLGVRVTERLAKSYDQESAFGNFVADLMFEARPGADVAITNGGGLRTDLDIGEVTFGRWFETYPFDNRFAKIRMSAKSLRDVLAQNLRRSKGILSIAGLRAQGSCRGAELVVELTRPNGRPVRDEESLLVVTSDFLASGGMEGTLGGAPDAHVEIDDSAFVRDTLADLLRKRGGTISGADRRIFDPDRPRLAYPGRRPVKCAP